MILAVTGHRPSKIAGGYSIGTRVKLTHFAMRQLEKIPFYPDRVLTGMALGWDLAVAEACGVLGIPYVACVPCDGQESRWSEWDQKRYRELLSKAHEVEMHPGGPYAAWKMLRRDEWMVLRCDRLLALYNGDASGGTAHTVRFAGKEEKPVTNCWQEWLDFSANKGPEFYGSVPISWPPQAD